MKTLSTIWIAAATAIAAVLACAPDTQAGLLRHYKLDETSGATMASVVGADGTYIGSPNLNGSYMTLNGVDQRAELSTGVVGIFHPAYETNRSLAMWIKLDATTGSDQFLLGSTVPSGGHGWAMRLLSDGSLNFIRNGIANHNSSVVSGIAADTWAHVGYSLSGSTLKFYVNGVQLGANVAAATDYVNNGIPVISIGAGGGPTTPTSFTAGSFADVRFYVNGFGPNNNDPIVANENGGVLSASDFAALAALTPVEPIPTPAALPVGLAMMGLIVARRRRR